jgi:hypothetical protein
MDFKTGLFGKLIIIHLKAGGLNIELNRVFSNQDAGRMSDGFLTPVPDYQVRQNGNTDEK